MLKAVLCTGSTSPCSQCFHFVSVGVWHGCWLLLGALCFLGDDLQYASAVLEALKLA